VTRSIRVPKQAILGVECGIVDLSSINGKPADGGIIKILAGQANPVTFSV